jgi:hypothetical protein
LRLESGLVRYVSACVELIRSAGLDGQVYASVSLLGFKGRQIITGRPTDYWDAVPIDTETLLLPLVRLDGSETVPNGLRPAFNAMWNAVGAPRSPHYDANGTWIT